MNKNEFEKKLANDIVVRQHYVPRCYLSAWSSNEKILECIDKITGRQFIQNVEGVANVRYFYVTETLSLEQIDFLYEMWIKDQKSPLKDSLMGWLRFFSEKDLFQNFCKEQGWDDVADWYLKNTEEKMFAQIEGYIPEWRTHLTTFDKKFWNNDDNVSRFVFWVMLQYVRTPQIQRIYLSNFEGTKFECLAQNTQNVFRWLLATIMAHNIIVSKNMKIILLRNRTNERFVTSDQPVVNICKSYKIMSKLKCDDFELFYPITPNDAVLISLKESYSPWLEINLNEQEVKTYNTALEKLAERFIFKTI